MCFGTIYGTMSNDSIKIPDNKNQKSFFCYTVERINYFCLKLKKKKSNNPNYINRLSLPVNVKAELFAKFDDELK